MLWARYLCKDEAHERRIRNDRDQALYNQDVHSRVAVTVDRVVAKSNGGLRIEGQEECIRKSFQVVTIDV